MAIGNGYYAWWVDRRLVPGGAWTRVSETYSDEDEARGEYAYLVKVAGDIEEQRRRDAKAPAGSYVLVGCMPTYEYRLCRVPVTVVEHYTREADDAAPAQ
jgi:hypothetical protein